MEEKELENRLTKLEVCTQNNTNDITDIKNTTNLIYEMRADMKGMFDEMKDIRMDNIESTKEIKSDIKDMKKDIGEVRTEMEDVKLQSTTEKAKKWDKVTWMFIAGVVGFALNYFLNMIPK